MGLYNTMILNDGDTVTLTREDDNHFDITHTDDQQIRINTKVITVLTPEALRTHLPTLNPVRLFSLWVSRVWWQVIR